MDCSIHRENVVREGQIAHGADFDEILEGYPDLVREDIQQAIEYAAWLAQEQEHTT